MKNLLHLVICYVVLAHVAFAQIRIPESVRTDLKETIESKAARAAKGIRVIDRPAHVRILGTSIVFDDYDDGLSVQVAYDREGMPPGFRMCWRSVRNGQAFENEIMVDSSGRFEYALINGLVYDPRSRPQGHDQTEAESETVSANTEPAPPRALLVDDETGELEPTELTQLMVSKEFSRLRTEISNRIKAATVRPAENAEPAPQKAAKKRT